MLPSRETAVVAAATLAVVVLAVLLHYESLPLLSRFVARTRVPRPRMLVPVFGLLAAHLAEIGLFALGARPLLGVPGVGELIGQGRPVVLSDVVYASALTYTTLGYGDVVPVGTLRFLFAMEALTGLVLITWSASLGFLEMQRHWHEDHAPECGVGADADRAPRPEEAGRPPSGATSPSRRRGDVA